jgi:hypothetical protein
VRIHVGIFLIVRIFNAVHAFAVSPEDFVVATNTRPSTSASSRSLVMASKGVTTRKASPALVTCMRSLPGVKLGVSFQIM